MKQHILFVDDEPNVLDGLRRMLRDQRETWDISFANGAVEALTLLSSEPIDAVVTDFNMPGMNGFALLTQIRNQDALRDIPVVFLTGNSENGLKRQALDLGATDLLSKPIVREDLLARLRSVLRLKAYQDEIKEHQATLERKVEERTRELADSRLDIVWRLGKAAEFRDEDTGFHVVRVGCYARTIAEAMGMDPKFVGLIFLTAPLHDIGKIGIPDSILLKQGSLTAEEWEIMRSHCEIGARILREDSETMRTFLAWDTSRAAAGDSIGVNPLLDIAATIALSHHEKWDGTGYPHNLHGEHIPIASRIVAIADVYDALSSPRPYKPAFPEIRVLRILQEGVHQHFDPQVYDAFVKTFDTIRAVRAQFPDNGAVVKKAA